MIIGNYWFNCKLSSSLELYFKIRIMRISQGVFREKCFINNNGVKSWGMVSS